MEAWELEAREAIRDLVARYNAFGDSGRWEDLLELFMPDAEFALREGGVFVGHEEMKAFFTGAASQGGRRRSPIRIWHHTSTLVIDLEGPDEAGGRCYYAVLTEAGLDHWGRYRDLYRKEGERWRFARRSVSVDGRVPGGWADQNLAGLQDT
jgi:hypothetical protein